MVGTHRTVYFVRKLNCIDMPSHHMGKTTTSHKKKQDAARNSCHVVSVVAKSRYRSSTQHEQQQIGACEKFVMDTTHNAALD